MQAFLVFWFREHSCFTSLKNDSDRQTNCSLFLYVFMFSYVFMIETISLYIYIYMGSTVQLTAVTMTMCDTVCFLSCIFSWKSQQIALLHRLKGSLKGWGLAELDLGECWNLSSSMPLEVQWVACSCWEGNRERMKRLISFADMRMFVLWVRLCFNVSLLAVAFCSVAAKMLY